MKVNKVIVGYLNENCYILKNSDETLIIDPGDEFNVIDNNIDGSLIGIIITHHHFDHVGALDELVNKYHVPVYDINSLREGINTIGSFNFEVIYTPGHKEDQISIYFKDNNIMFTGDFIFKGTIGRCDLKGGNYNDMLTSINKIMKYDDNITIYSGHGDETVLGIEKQFLKQYK